MPLYEIIPLEAVVGTCCVLDLYTYCKGEVKRKNNQLPMEGCCSASWSFSKPLLKMDESLTVASIILLLNMESDRIVKFSLLVHFLDWL